MSKSRNAVVCRPGVRGGKDWSGPTPDEPRARTAKKCRGGFLPRNLGWEHSIAWPAPIPSPPRGQKTEGGHIVYLYSKYLHLGLLAPLLNLSAAGFYVFFDPLALSFGHCLGLLLSLHIIISASSSLPPLAVTLLFLSSVCGVVYV